RERALHLPRARAAWVALSEPRSARAPCSYRPSRPKRLAARDRGGLPLSLKFRASSSGKADPSRLSAAFAPVVLAIALLSLRAPNANSASKSASVSAIPSGVSPKFGLRDLLGVFDSDVPRTTCEHAALKSTRASVLAKCAPRKTPSESIRSPRVLCEPRSGAPPSVHQKNGAAHHASAPLMNYHEFSWGMLRRSWHENDSAEADGAPGAGTSAGTAVGTCLSAISRSRANPVKAAVR